VSKQEHNAIKPGGEIILYQTEDGQTRIECRLENENIWLTQAQMAELFQTSVPNVSMHIRNILAEKELREESVVKEFLITAADGKNYRTSHYSLEMIIAVGYRVKSSRGTAFRQWAAAQLKEYLVKGFVLDDERLKRAGGGGYFEELLARIRDIRSSEKVFWRKVLEIYATSVDYDPQAEMTLKFFRTVQNKMHWAVHGQTAAEVIVARADAGKPQMGLTSWTGIRPRKDDVTVAKNYLTAEELDALNRIVTAYLEFAELQAKQRRAMTMRDWIAKLDDFLRLSEREILTHAGKVSHELAVARAEAEFAKYRMLEDAKASLVEQQLEDAVKHLKQLPAKKSGKKGKKQ
jgi:hypothetical protein